MPFLVVVFATQPLDGLLLFFDFAFRRQRLDVDRDLIVEKRQPGQPVDNAGIRPAGPAREGENGVVLPVEIEPDLRQAHPVRIPAVLLK